MSKKSAKKSEKKAEAKRLASESLRPAPAAKAADKGKARTAVPPPTPALEAAKPRATAPRTTSPKATPPVASAPKAAAATASAPARTAPKTSTPKTSTPKKTAPKTTTPNTAAPEVAAPKTDAPKVAVAEPVAASPRPTPAAAPAPAPTAAPAAVSAPPQDSKDVFDKLTGVATEIMADAGKASMALMKGLDEAKPMGADESADIAKVFTALTEYWVKDPARLVKAQKDLSVDVINLWSGFLKQASGEKAEPAVPMPARDPRFSDKDWSENPYFNLLKQAYFLGTHWADTLVEKADLDDTTKRKAAFYVRQLAGAFSPSNFVLTNPELLRQTVEEKGENLARGMKMLAEDIEAGNGQVKIRQSDPSPFKVGENIANTPGKVVYRNELIELIQYTPTTDTVFKTPLVIVPPWINKFYILDLNAEKSFIRWAVSEGFTVFVISWTQPTAELRHYDFGAYMQRGVIEAVNAALEITGEQSVDTVGYCVGGTMLSVTLAWMAQDPKEARKIRSATLFTTQVDFTHAGDLLAFVDEAQIRSVEEMMAEYGYLPGSKMAGAFNMLRPNDLIWSYVVNNYLKGKNPAPFDLLYWNADSTRMPEANHSFYLRNCYLNNNFSKKKMKVAGRTLDLSLVKQRIYNLAAKEDHIAPALSVFEGSKYFGGDVTYVLAGSGHIAGVINPVSKPKYQYWTNGPAEGDFGAWQASATETPGTWWPHWLNWVAGQEPRVPARQPGAHPKFPALDAAPGTYVKIKA